MKIDVEYIGFLADDNVLFPSYSAAMTAFLDTHPECGAVFCNQKILLQDGSEDANETRRNSEYFGRDRLLPGPVPATLTPFLLDKNSIPLEACLFRRSVWQKAGPFNADVKGAFDFHFLARALLKGIRFGFISDALMGFRVHSESYSATRIQEHLHGAIRCMQDLRKEFPGSAALFHKKEFLLKKRLFRFSSWPQRMTLAVGLLSDRAKIALSGSL